MVKSLYYPLLILFLSNQIVTSPSSYHPDNLPSAIFNKYTSVPGLFFRNEIRFRPASFGEWRRDQLKPILYLPISVYFWGRTVNCPMYTSLINAIERIIRLDDAEKEYIQTLFQEKKVKKGDFFLKEGKVCKEVGFIGKGLVRYFINNNGEELVYGFGKENDFICNYESFLDHSLSAKNIQFIENSVILTISYDNLQLLYEKVKEGQKLGRLVCEQIFVTALKEITSFYTHSPEQRYIDFITTYPDLMQRIPQYYISAFVGVKPPSLSRIRRRLASS